MYGGGIYQLTAVKEMKATENFLKLDDRKKNCQNKETLEKCTSRNGLQDMINKYGCIHYKLAKSKFSELLCNQQHEIEPQLICLLGWCGSKLPLLSEGVIKL